MRERASQTMRGRGCMQSPSLSVLDAIYACVSLFPSLRMLAVRCALLVLYAFALLTLYRNRDKLVLPRSSAATDLQVNGPAQPVTTHET